MLWMMGTADGQSGENCTAPHEHNVRVWTTVENRWMKIWSLTCKNKPSSAIHKPYNNYTKIS